MVIEEKEKKNSGNPPQRKNAAVQISGLGAAILVGGVLATTALGSVFFSRKRGQRSEDGRGLSPENLKQAENGSNGESCPDRPHLDASETNEGAISDEETAAPWLFHRSSSLEIEVNEEGTSSLQKNEEQSVRVMSEPENVDADCSLDKIDPELILETENSGMSGELSSVPSEPYVCVMSEADNDVVENTAEKVQSVEEDLTLDDKLGAVTDVDAPVSVPAEPNGQIMCVMPLAENRPGEYSTEYTQPPEEDHLMVERNAANGESVFSSEKIEEPLLAESETDDASTTEGILPHENTILGEWENDAALCNNLKIQIQTLTLLQDGDRPGEVEMMISNARCSGGVVDLEAVEEKKDEGAAESLQKAFPVEEEEMRIVQEVQGKLLEDLYVKEMKPKLKPEAEKRKYAALLPLPASNQARRRVLIGVVSVVSSLSFSHLMGLSFLKLCLIMLLTGVLSEIHGY